MTLPTILEGETPPIFDEEMGNSQETNRAEIEGAQSTAAMQLFSESIAPMADGEPALIYITRVNSNQTDSVPNLPTVSVQTSPETNQELILLPRPHHDLARNEGTPRQRKRGHEPDSPPTATPQNEAEDGIPSGGEVIEEVDTYGVRTKVRVTTNEAEVRQRIQERDEAAAARDALAAEGAVWKRRVEEIALELQSALNQRNSLQQNLTSAAQHLAEANRKITGLEGRIEKIKSEARGQIESLKIRMATAAAEHVKIMGDWETQRKARESETQQRYESIRAEGLDLKEKLNEALSQIQELKDQYAAQIQQSRQGAPREQRTAAAEVINPPQSIQILGHSTGHAQFSGPRTAEPPPSRRAPQIMQRTIAPSNAFTGSISHDMPGIVPTSTAPLGHSTPVFQQAVPRPPSRPLSHHSNSPSPPGHYSMTAQLPPLPASARQLPLSGHLPPDIRTVPPDEPIHTLPITDSTPVNAPQSVHPVANTSQGENPSIRSARVPHTNVAPTVDIRMRGPADHAADSAELDGEADTEDEGTELPAMVDIRTVKPKFKKRGGRLPVARNEPVLQRTAQRRIEVIAPPAQYARSRLSQPLLGKLHLPNPSPTSRDTFDAEQTTRADRLRTVRSVVDRRPQQPRASAFASPLQHMFRERSPPIDPPGSIFGQHNMPSTRAHRSVEPSLRPAPSMRPRSPTYGTEQRRDTSRAPSAANYPPKEATPDSYHGGADSRRSGGIEASAAADLVASMKSIADQMRSLPYDLAAQLRSLNEESKPQDPPYTPQRKNNRHFPFRSPSKKRGRTPMRQELLNIGRPEMNSLLHIKEDNDIVHSIGRHVVSIKDLEDYAAGVGSAPTLDPLRICWDDPHAEWNMELADKFQEFLVTKYPAFEGRGDEIQDYFIQRIETLQKIIKDRMVREDEDIQAATERVAQKWEQEQRAKRRRTRQRKRLSDRLETCRLAAEHDPVYEEMFHVVDCLNVDGMSSDDTDGERYSVRILPWRDPAMIPKMDLLDRLRDELTVYGNRRPGGLPHPRDRRVTQAESEREAPATLPRNLYRHAWLLGLSQFQLARLDPGEEIIVPEIEQASW